MADVLHKDLTGTELHAPFIEGATAPASPVAGMYWLNTTTMIVSRYNGTAWVQVPPAPSLPSAIPVYTAGDFIDPWVHGVIAGTVDSSPRLVLAQQSYIVPIYLAKDCTLDAFGVTVRTPATAGKKGKMALFAPGADGLAGATLVQVSNVAVDTTGNVIVTTPFPSPLNVSKGHYWVGLGVETGGEFETVSITPVLTTVPYQLNTGASKVMFHKPTNMPDEYGATWLGSYSGAISNKGYAYRFGVRIA